MGVRYIYTREQLEQYFSRISIPESKRVYSVSSLSDPDKLNFLDILQKHQLVKVPWENLTQHYSWHRVINIRPTYLFKKIVTKPGVGGYCMEANYFFHLILYNLGFDVYMAGSRIYHADTGRYGGWTHVVNIVTLGDKKYLLDGGMGPNGPHCPVPLEPGVTLTQVDPGRMRLDYEPIGQNLDRSQKIWVFKHSYDHTMELEPVYCFTDLEFLPEDVESMNFEPMLDKQTFFTHKVVCVRFTTDKETDTELGPGSPNEVALEGEIDGSLALNHDVLKWRRRGNKVLEIPLKTEEERLAALKRYFGISFEPEDIESIHGTAAQLGPVAKQGGPA
ncbi:cysteine proteinase [Rhizodiscina lignyota]|uniref:Cysteine proteinase n=1 Tax=Rhizodiscina lignyota TaxID=1504668 RepID=A0A9P4IBK5_9PEZI|nr:cysteine proteinase [Rhizodiscina lignyota]